MSEELQAHPHGAAALWLPGTLFVLLVVVVYADPLFLRRNFAGRDLLGYNLPVEKSVHDAYARGRLPVWISEVSGGRPLLPNPNTGAFYPLRPLLSLVPFPLAMRIYPVLHWALAGIGTILLLRSLGTSRAAAWVGAVSYAFSGVSVSEVFYSNYQPGMTLLPWILWAFHRPAPRMASNILLLSFFFALDFMAGDVFASSLAILCCALWLLLEMDGTQGKRGLVALALSLFLALLLAAPQIVATALWIPETNRAVRGMTLEDVFTYSIHAFRVLELVIPYPFGAVWEGDHAFVWGFPVFFGRAEGFFLSLYAGSFAVVALVSARGPRGSGARFARVLLAFTLALSVPPSLLPASWRAASSPLPLRYPEKLAVGIAFALAILAGGAFDRFRRPERRPRWVPVVGLVLVVLAALVSLFPVAAGAGAVRLVGSEPWLASRAARLLPAAVTEAAILWVVTAIALELLRSRSAMAVLSSVALLTLCVLVPNRKIAQTLHEEEIFDPSRLVRFLDRADPARTYRVLGESIFHPESELAALDAESGLGQTSFPRRSWTQLTGALWSRGTVFNYDYDAGDLARLESLRRTPRIASATTDLASLFGSLALRWGVRYADQAPVPGYGPFARSGTEIWDENPSSLPDIRLINQWREAEDPRQALGELLQLAPGQVVLETGRGGSGTARPGRLRILEKSPERLHLETETVDATWLFVLRGYWNYRTVAIDGREVEDVPAQLAFSAVPVPPGRHRVEWRERVPGGRVSRWGPVIFALAVAGLYVRERRGVRSR